MKLRPWAFIYGILHMWLFSENANVDQGFYFVSFVDFDVGKQVLNQNLHKNVCILRPGSATQGFHTLRSLMSVRFSPEPTLGNQAP